MKLTRRERFWMTLSVALLLLIFVEGRSLPIVDAKDEPSPSGSSLERDDPYAQLDVFTDVLTIVQHDYVKPVSSKSLVEGAIKGMLTSLDPHSGYLDPDFYADLQVQTKGEFGGLGLEVTIRDGLLVVVSPMDGSPAARAGLRAGDAIVKIDGRYTKDFSLIDAVKKLRGPKGSAIALTVHRKGRGEFFDVSVVRDNIQVKSVRSRYLGDGIGLIRLSQFMETSADDLQASLRRFYRENNGDAPRGLILDLRNNPGGLLTQAIRIADLFLRDGIIVYTDGRVEEQKQKFYAHPRGTEPDYPMVVIVNGGSASASEIIAGAFKDHGRAIILGTRTFGKGSVQTITPLKNRGALSLTTALYYTKSGQSIQLTGVKPDVEMEDPKVEAERTRTDRERTTRREMLREGDLPGAISNPSGNVEESPLNKLNQVPANDDDFEFVDIERDPVEKLLNDDALLARAQNLLRDFRVIQPDRVASAPDHASVASDGLGQ